MNEELKKFLQSQGLRKDATEEEIRLFVHSLKDCPELEADSKKQLREFAGKDGFRQSQRFLPETINEANRSIGGVLASEQAVRMIDWERYEIVDEILLADGMKTRRNEKQVVMLDSHMRHSVENILGSTVNIRVENGEIVGDRVFSETEEKVFQKAKEGHIRDTSIGYEVKAALFVEPGETTELNGRSFTAGERTLKVVTDWQLNEDSLTPIGADSRAGLRSKKTPSQPTAGDNTKKQGNKKMNEQLRNLLISCGMSSDLTDDQARGYMLGSGMPKDFSDDQAIGFFGARKSANTAPPKTGNSGERNENAPAPEAPQLSEEQRSLLEKGQRAAILEECDALFSFAPGSIRSTVDDCKAKILKGEMTADQARAAVVRAHAEKSPVPGIQVQTSENELRDRLSNAMLAKFDKSRKLLTEDQLSGARQFQGMRVSDMCRHILENRGVRTEGMQPYELINAARSHGTSDFANIVSATARTAVTMGYGRITPTWDKYMEVMSVDDLESYDMLQFGGTGKIAEVTENGEVKQNSFVDNAEAIRGKKYIEDFVISWETLLADRFDLIVGVPMKQSERWAYTLNLLPIELLISNPTMSDTKALFHNDHNNIIHTSSYDGSSATKAADAVAQHRLKLRLQKPLDEASNSSAANSLGINLTHVLCGATYESNFFNALYEGGRFSNNTEAFIRSQNISLLSEAEIELAESGSTKFSFGIGDGNTNPCMKMALLGGSAAPILTQTEGQNDDFKFRVKGVAAAGVADWRGITKATGVADPS